MVKIQSFQNLLTTQSSGNARLVPSSGGFKAANEGSFLGRGITLLKEKLRPGLVKQENAAAYQAAKQAFISKGGDELSASLLFDAKSASGTKLTAADIKLAGAHFVDDGDLAAIKQTLRENAATGQSAEALTMQASPIDSTQSLATQFVTDAHRQTVKINGTTVDKNNQSAAVASFCAIAQAQNISKKDIEGLSKFLNQATPGAMMGHLQATKVFTLPDGQTCNISMNTNGSKEYSVTREGPGRYKIDFVGTGPVQGLFPTDGSSPPALGPSTASFKLSFQVQAHHLTGEMSPPADRQGGVQHQGHGRGREPYHLSVPERPGRALHKPEGLVEASMASIARMPAARIEA